VTELSIPKKPVKEGNTLENWYPPGSRGRDVFEYFYESGLLKQFIKQGKEYVFMSNVENLGAIIGRQSVFVI